jgi:hypothetical protein
MPAALKAGAAYFALVFAAGFALGTVRVLALVPRLGEFNAVLIEVPVMIAISWFACAFLIRRMAVPATVPARLLMGALAFALLMAAETAVSVLAFGRTVSEHFATYQTARAQVGLAAQAVFALLPLVQGWTSRR